MGPDLTAPGTRTACPSCGGRLRPEATFCGQCYADFRPPPPPPPAPVAPIAPSPTAAYGRPAADPLTAPLLDVVLPAGAVPVQGAPAHAPAPAEGAAEQPAAPEQPKGWPCSKCDALNEFSATACTVCSSPFLAVVSETTKVNLVLPIVGDLSRYGRGQRAMIALGALAALLVPLALITLLMTHAPPTGSGTSGGTGGSTSQTTTGGTDQGTTNQVVPPSN